MLKTASMSSIRQLFQDIRWFVSFNSININDIIVKQFLICTSFKKKKMKFRKCECSELYRVPTTKEERPSYKTLLYIKSMAVNYYKLSFKKSQ
jgi:hypothetical protein